MEYLRNLYEEVILDHNRHPRNFNKHPSDANRRAAIRWGSLVVGMLTLQVMLGVVAIRVSQLKATGRPLGVGAPKSDSTTLLMARTRWMRSP